MGPFLARFGDTLGANGKPALKSGHSPSFLPLSRGSLTATVIVSGRRGGLVVAYACVNLGAIVQLAVDRSNPQPTVGRLILGIGLGQISNCKHFRVRTYKSSFVLTHLFIDVPLYISESSPTAVRGIVVGSWQFLLAIGQVIGACVD